MLRGSAPRKDGFTLIELSIVLVIIGLIAGSVLAGRELIHAAKLRSVVSEQEKIKLATNTFRVKYDCLPGDCKNAQLFFPTTQNGDGNKRIDRNWSGILFAGDYYYQELLQFWKMLGLSGMLDGDYRGMRANNAVPPYQYYIFGGAGATDYPTSYKNGAGYTAGWPPLYLNNYGFFKDNAVLLNDICDVHSSAGCAPVTSLDAWNIDTKIDDGLPGKGKIEAHNGGDRSGNGYGGCHQGNDLENGTQRDKGYTKGTGLCKMLFYLN